MKIFTYSKQIGVRTVRSKQTDTLVKQITCWLTTVIVLFCAVFPLRGVCSCDICPYSGSVDPQFVKVVSLAANYTGSACCPHSGKNNVSNNVTNNVNVSNFDAVSNFFDFNFDFGFCTCICTDSPQPLNTDSNQLLKLQPKDQFPNSLASYFAKSILSCESPSIDRINTGISNYTEFYNSPHSRSITRLHSILNIWQI
jgi:hypothetical protein